MDVLYILLGWLLGILSPAIISKISNHYKKIAIQKVITEELKDTKKRLTGIPLKIYSSYGDLSIEHFEWLKRETNNFNDLISDEEEDEKEKYQKLLKEDIKLENVVKLFNINSATDNPAFHFKKIELGVINSNQINFEMLGNNFLTKILEIGFQVRVYNEEIQSVNEYLKMTFDSSVTETNHQIIQNEIKRKNYTIAQKAMLIVKKINRVI